MPDTSAFGRSLERYLQRVERTLRIQIPTEADTSGIRDDLERVKQQTESDPVDVPVKAQTDDFIRRVRTDVAKLSRTAEVHIPLTPEGENLRRDLAAKVAEVERLTRIEIPVDAREAADFRQKVAAAVAEVEALARAASPEIVVNTRVDRRGLAGLASVGSSIAAISTRAAGVASSIALWGTLLAGVAGLIGLIAPAFALLLPGVLAVAAGIGVLIAGADGLKKAFEPLAQQFKGLGAALSDTVSRGIRPLVRQLAPGLVGAMATGLQSVAESLNLVIRRTLTFLGSAPGLQLVREISGGVAIAFRQLATVAAPLTRAFLQLTSASLQAFEDMSRGMAASALRFAEWVNQAVESGAAARAISEALSVTGAVFRVLGSVVSTLVTAFRPLGPLVIQIAESIGRLLDAVAAMVAPIVRFVSANRELSAVLATVGLALAAVYGGPITAIVAGVILAARVFDLLRGRTEQITGALRPLISGFQSFTASLRAGFNTVVPALITFAEAVGPVLQELGRKLVATVGPALASLGDTLQNKVAPALARFLVAVAPIAAALLRAFGTSVIAAIKAVFQVLEALGTILAGVMDVITGLLTGDWATLWQGAKDVVSGFASGVVAILRAALLLPSVQMFRAVASAVIGFFASLGSSIASAVAGAVSAALSAITGMFSAVATAIAGFFSGLGAVLAGVFTSVVGAVAGVASQIGTVLAAAFRATVAVLTGIWDAFWSSAFGQMVQAALDLVVAIVRLRFVLMQEIVTTALGVVAAVVRTALNAVQATVAVVTSAIVNIVTTGWRTATTAVATAVAAVRAAVTAGFNASTAAVRAAMTATQTAVTAAWGAIRPYVQAAVSQVIAAVQRLNQIAAIVGGAFRSAYQAAVGWVGNLVSLAAGLESRIRSAVGNLGSTLYGAGRDLIQGLINGITSRISAVTGAINGITSRIRGFFPGSPVREGPLRSFNGGRTGRELIEMLASGLNDSGPVDVAVDRLTSRIAGVTAGAVMNPSRMSPTLAAATGGITINTYNPVPETPSETVTRSMRRLAVLGPA